MCVSNNPKIRREKFGMISLYMFFSPCNCLMPSKQYPVVSLHHTCFRRQSHSLAVKRLRWRPRTGRVGRVNNKEDGQPDGESEVEEESSWVQLASASADHSVKIFNINKLAL